MLSLFLMFALMLSILVMFLSSNIAKSHYNLLEKMTPFECGFNPSNKSRVPFSLQFFLIALIFIIFDIEIILIIPAPLFSMKSLPLSLSITLLILIIFLGLLHEWKEGSLKWV
uniref:NADH-ubiquinone oxidoreductase chain 3 n=1 Tax=Opilio parietinus TaxID=121214 RepID=E3UHH2_9ARAC|nr:NADH dehydrogenase subunit 3 [Opilio parietinus]ADI92913.1 NADH dehydrogenase subunit 3 [Opilio parietinus]